MRVVSSNFFTIKTLVNYKPSINTHLPANNKKIYDHARTVSNRALKPTVNGDSQKMVF